MNKQKFKRKIVNLIESKKNYKIFISCTGAGAGMQNKLWKIPGISKILVGANFPYHRNEFDKFIGYAPEKYASLNSSISLAMSAYLRALEVSNETDAPVGFGMSCSVHSNEPHKGEHRIHIAGISKEKTFLMNVILNKKNMNRISDGEISDEIGCLSLLKLLGNSSIEFKDKFPNHKFEVVNNSDELFFEEFMKRPFVSNKGSLFENEKQIKNPTYFPGSFNPPHEGHFGIEENSKRNVIYTISVDHPEKQHLKIQDILQRTSYLRDKNVLFTKHESLYIDKFRNKPNSTFIIGADAFVKTLNPKWGVDPKEIIKVLRESNIRLYLVNRDKIDIKSYITEFAIDDIVFILDGEWKISSTSIRGKL